MKAILNIFQWPEDVQVSWDYFQEGGTDPQHLFPLVLWLGILDKQGVLAPKSKWQQMLESPLGQAAISEVLTLSISKSYGCRYPLWMFGPSMAIKLTAMWLRKKVEIS